MARFGREYSSGRRVTSTAKGVRETQAVTVGKQHQAKIAHRKEDTQNDSVSMVRRMGKSN